MFLSHIKISLSVSKMNKNISSGEDFKKSISEVHTA